MVWVIRAIAYIIDAIIISIVAFIIGVILAAVIVLSGAFFLFVGYWLFLLTFGILSLLYFILLDVYRGATIGKGIMGLEVQLVKGGRISLGKSFIRNISKIFWLFLFLDWLIAIVTPGPDNRQKWTDRYAGTTVVQVRKSPIGSTEPSPPPPPPPPPT
jgi:uncharacterized RDD family membrane protein YckC